jgi:hypothetical protein
MRKFTRISPLLVLLLVLSVVSVPAAPAVAQEAAPQAVADDEIAVIELSNGRIRIDDPSQPPGIAPFTWNSGSDTGYGWLAAGDFNGDNDEELVAIKGGTLKVFDPFVQPGRPSTEGTVHVLSGSLAYELLATGDIDRDGKDEIIVTHTGTGSGVSEVLQVWDGGETGTAWTMTRSESFGGTWESLAVGDMNNDGYEDVALFRDDDKRVKVYSGFGWTPALSDKTYTYRWLAMALGNISSSYPGAEMALTRAQVEAQLNSLILFRLSTTGLVDLLPNPQPDYRFYPYFKSVGIGDANGDGDDEVVLVRDPVENKTTIKLINPAGNGMRDFQQAIGYGVTAWKQVRLGDVDGDLRDEPVVMRPDRYRIYWQVELDDSHTDYPGSYKTPAHGPDVETTVDYDRPRLVLGNFDGPGVIVSTPFVVSPLQVTVVQRAGRPYTDAVVRVTRDVFATGWTASIISGFPGLSIVNPSGTTPSDLVIRVSTQAVGPYYGTVRVQANDPTIQGAVQDVAVTAIVVDKNMFLPYISK